MKLNIYEHNGGNNQKAQHCHIDWNPSSILKKSVQEFGCMIYTNICPTPQFNSHFVFLLSFNDFLNAKVSLEEGHFGLSKQ